MYAAAGGASLASRQARRKQKQHHTNENLHQQFHKRFQQLQHQHAPACAEGYHYMRTSSSGFLSPSHLPSCTDLHGRDGAAIDYSIHEHLIEGKSSVAWFDREKKGGSSPYSEIAPPLISQHSHGKLKLSEAQRKWVKRNKVHDSSFGGSSLEDVRGGLHSQYDAAANMLLYIGLCAVALGLVIAFVGTGEKGFKTVQLRLIGPTMIGCGTLCCFLRILFCFCPTKCMRKRFKHRHKNKSEILSDAAQLNRHECSMNAGAHLDYYKHLPFRSQMSNNFLLFEQTHSPFVKGNKKRVSIATKPYEKHTVTPTALGNDVNKVPDFIIDDAASDSLSTLRELSPLREEDLIDFKQSTNSFDNLRSLDSSLEFLNEQLNDYENTTPNKRSNEDQSYALTTEEQLSRLKSTLTFRDSVDFADTRLMISYDEFDLQDDLESAVPSEKDGNECGKNTKSSEMELIDVSCNHELVLSAETLRKQS